MEAADYDGIPRAAVKLTTPDHVKVRDAAIENAFKVLAKSNGVLPRAASDGAVIKDVPAYLSGLERDCVREMFAKIGNWRVPQPHTPDAWRDWPLPNDDPMTDLFEALVLVGSVDSTTGAVKLDLHILHPRRKSIQLSEHSVPLAAVLGADDKAVRNAEAIVRARNQAGSDITFTSLDYIGDLTSTLAIAQQLKLDLETSVKPRRGVIHAILPGGPRVAEPWLKPKPLETVRAISLNSSQHEALSGLSTNMELISGPPGTGKSTTIHALVTECMPPNELVVLTAVQNRAVEALVDKFSKTGTPFIVSGRRITGEALKWTLEAQTSADPAVRKGRKAMQGVTLLIYTLRMMLQNKLKNIFTEVAPEEASHRAKVRMQRVRKIMAEATKASSASTSSTSSAFLSTMLFSEWKEAYVRRHDKPPAQRALKDQVETWMSLHCNPWSRAADAVLRHSYGQAHALQRFLQTAQERLIFEKHTAEEQARNRITTAAKALMCTSAAIGPALRDEHLSKLAGRATTVVGDEAGTLGDRHMLPIIFNCPRAVRVVLVGDTKQLPVFSYLRGEDFPCSMMERLEREIEPRMLTTQYRMPPKLADVVSACFYDGRLKSAPREDTDEEVRPMRFVSIEGMQRPERPDATSMVNEAEARAACTEANKLAGKNSTHKVAVLTPYAAQVRFMRKLVKYDNIEVMTVDGSQGREWEHVVLTLVRTERDGTFVNDPRRQCVAMSRAKLSMILVAHPALAAALPHLRTFWDFATFELLPARQNRRSPSSAGQLRPSQAPSAPVNRAAEAPAPQIAASDPLEVLVERLKPNGIIQERYASVVQVLKDALLKSEDAEMKVSKVEPTGSFAMGTNVQGKSDLDVLVILKDFDPSQVTSYLEAVECLLRAGKVNIDDTKTSTKYFTFTYNSIHVDLLVGGEHETLGLWPQCLVELENSARLAWKPSFSPKMIQFVRKRSLEENQPLGRDIALLAKHWRDDVKWEGPHGRPCSILLVLLVFYALEAYSEGEKCDSVRSGFKLFLAVVVEYEGIWGTWFDWFDHSDIPASLTAGKPPLLLDPTDPTTNVAASMENWDAFANEAKKKLQSLS